MVYIGSEAQSEGRARIAAGVARRFDATLIGVSALCAKPGVGFPGVVTEVTESDFREMREKLAKRGSWFHGLFGTEHPRLEWRPALTIAIEALALEARAADLIV